MRYPMKKNKNPEQNQKSELFIGLGRKMQKIVGEYCTASGIDPQDVGYHIGLLNGLTQLTNKSEAGEKHTTSDPTAMKSLFALHQIFFYAGVYYAKTHPEELVFGYGITPPNADKKQSESVKPQLPDYFG
jgi:hypothetical protein